MATKIRDIVVKVGEYQDRNSGATKGRWKNVGALMQNEDDKSMFVMLDRTFNPAGVPGQDERSSVLLSCFLPQEQRAGPGHGTTSHQQGDRPHHSQGAGAQSGGAGTYDDEIPF